MAERAADTNPAGRLLCFGSGQSEDTSRDIKWGIKRGVENGSSGYAEFVCFGYKRGDNGQLVIDEPDAKIVRRMFEMRASGCSLGSISNWLYESKIPSPTGITSASKDRKAADGERDWTQKQGDAAIFS